MKNGFRSSGLTGEHLTAALLLVFIGLSAFAMFTTSGTGDEMNWIGINVERLDAETQAARGIPAGVGGVIVQEVDGIAGRAGVLPGDVIVGINGNVVRDMYDFQHFVGEADITKGGAQIDLIRNGMRMPVFVFPSDATAQAPAQAAPVAPVAPVAPAAPPAAVAGNPFAISPQWLGIEGDTVRAADAMALGLPAGAQGVAIDGVAIGSRAHKAGLVNQDVIVAMNGQRISSASELWNALGRVNVSDSVELGVYRNGQLVTVAVPAGAGAVAGTPAASPAGAMGVIPVPPGAAPAGGFAGRMGGMGLGPGGLLVCPKCGTRVAHQRAVPCFTVPCPSCGTMMTRMQ